MAQCLTPLNLKDPKKGQSFPIPCGKCPVCIKKRTSQWSFRLQKEAEVSSSAHFITLTYNTESCPITAVGFPTLEPIHVTNFLKRLRKKSKNKLKYYYVGEYGSETQRPHYHMLLFNAEIEDIESTWNLGAVHYGKVEGASIGYTLKYMCKIPHSHTQPWKKRVPEFGRMSKGIGSNYLTADTMYYHSDKNYLLERVCMQVNDKKVSMPRYYKERIYDKMHKIRIQQEAKKRSEEQYKKLSEEELHSQIEHHKSLFRKMQVDRDKNKFV